MQKDSTIVVQTEQPIYSPEDIVTGKVLLNLDSPIEAQNISIRVKGVEKSQWETKGTADAPSQSHSGKNIFYSTSEVLHSWNGQIPAGQYCFPFSFKLLKNLPGSFKEEGDRDNTKYSGLVKYKVKAFIVSSKGQKIKGNQIMTLREPERPYQPPVFKEQPPKNKKKSCFGGDGANLDDLKLYFTMLNEGPSSQNAGQKPSGDNKTHEFTLNDITCHLKRTLVLRSPDGKSFTNLRSLQTHLLSGALIAKKTAIQLRQQGTIDAIKNGKPTEQGSTTGSLVECIYTIKVECSVEDICSSDEIEMTFNTVIVPMKNEDYGKYVPPANWNPQTFPVFTVATQKAK